MYNYLKTILLLYFSRAKKHGETQLIGYDSFLSFGVMALRALKGQLCQDGLQLVNEPSPTSDWDALTIRYSFQVPIDLVHVSTYFWSHDTSQAESLGTVLSHSQHLTPNMCYWGLIFIYISIFRYIHIHKFNIIFKYLYFLFRKHTQCMHMTYCIVASTVLVGLIKQ